MARKASATKPKRLLDRNARIAVTAAVVALLAGPIILVGDYIAGLHPDEPITISNEHAEEFVMVAGHTMLLKKGSTARRIADWLNVEGSEVNSFVVGDQSFAANSAQLTPTGSDHLIHLAMVMRGYPSLTARILVPARADGAVPLEQMRADRLRDGLVAQRIEPDRVSERYQLAQNQTNLMVELAKS